MRVAMILMVFAMMATDNPLLDKWPGPYGGVPPFDKIKVAHFKPAIEAGIALQRKELAAIAANPNPADFENTIAAFEDCGRIYTNIQLIFSVWASTMSNAEFQKLEAEMAPVMAAFQDEVYQNAALFKRIAAVHNTKDKSKWTPEQTRLTWYQYTTFVSQGARLSIDAKKRVAAINSRMATLFTSFSQNVLADEEGWVTKLPAAADRAGLPDQTLTEVKNTRSSMEPFLTFSTRRDLREKVWKNYINRGDNGDAHDNNKLITEILTLRAERAKLLGYQTHAHWRLVDSMAKTPERAMQLMEAVWKPAVARVHEEVRDMQALADKEGAAASGFSGKIAPWDYRFYAEKVRKAKFDLDENEIKPYLQLDRLREGMFFVAGELFNFSFTQVKNVAVYQADMSVYEVKDKTSGKHVGLWYFDPYARDGKHSGAWMNAYRNQERFKRDVTTIVSNNSNFLKPTKPGEPILISWDDATTLFHEFGHALHGLSSNVTYPTVSGTNVARDYVEFPSQLLEHWLSTPEVLNKYALHYKTGKPIPSELVAKIKKAATFNKGFDTVEYLAAALIDMKLHLAGDKAIDPDAFERDTLKSLGMPEEIVMRHRTPQFSHVFSGDGYSAGYYSYLWSDTLTADAFDAFLEGKGPYDKAVAEKLRKHVFSTGNTVDPADAYREFRGKDPGISALMKKRGFPG